MSCRHGGCNQDNCRRECRACLEDVVRNLRYKVTVAEERMHAMEAAGGAAALKRLEHHKTVVDFLSWCDTVFGYIIRNPKTLEFETYLKQQRRRVQEFLAAERS